MILADPGEIDHYSASGIWGRATLDGLLARNAADRPYDMALKDAEARPTPRAFPIELTWKMLDTLVSRLARLFVESGIRPDEVVGIQLPNIAEAVIAHLAALRAGLVPAALPLLWRRRELTAAAHRLGLSALVSVNGSGSVRNAEIMRQVAAEAASVRLVLAFDTQVPDGVRPLNQALAGDAAAECLSIEREGNPADHLAMVTFDTARWPPLPMARSHNQWLAAAAVAVIAGRVDSAATLATAMAPASLAGLATGLVSWLLSGCRLALLMPDDVPAAAGSHSGISHLVLPGPAAMALRAAEPDRHAKLIRLWRSGSELGAGADTAGIDVLSLGEVALWAGKRRFAIPLADAAEAEPQAELLYARMRGHPHRAQDADHPGALLRGTLSVAGPQLPSMPLPVPDGGADDANPLDPDGFRPTGLRCSLIGTQPAAVRVLGHIEDVFVLGGLHVPAKEVDQLYAGCPGVRDAAAFTVPDPVLGSRLQAAVASESPEDCSVEAMRAYLCARGVAPYLIPEAVVHVDKVPRGYGGGLLRSLLETALPGDSAGVEAGRSPT